MAGHNDFGRLGEQLIKKYLEENGYELLEENWTYRKAEIDLIAYKDGIIIFTEVKTRSSAKFGEPEVFITRGKIKQMAIAATEYIRLMNHQGEVRFDVASILFEGKDNYTINYIEDAFWPE